MRKILTIVLAVVMLTSFAPRAHSIGAFLSWWDGNDLTSGFGLGVKHDFNIIPVISADVRASWLGFGDVNTFPIEAGAYASLGLFYGGLGVGYYILDSDLDNSFGGFVLGGGKLTVLGLGAFGELKYTHLESQGINANGIGVNIGATLPF